MIFDLDCKIFFSFLIAMAPVRAESSIILNGDVDNIYHSIDAKQRRIYYKNFTKERNYPGLDRHSLINLLFMLLIKHGLIPFDANKFAPIFYEDEELDEYRKRLLAPEMVRNVYLGEKNKLIISLRTKSPLPLYSYDEKVAPDRPRSCIAQVGQRVGEFELYELHIEISDAKMQVKFKAGISYEDSARELFSEINDRVNGGDYPENALRALALEFLLVLEQYKAKTYVNPQVLNKVPSDLKFFHLLHYSSPHSSAFLFLYSPRFIYQAVLGYMQIAISQFLMNHYKEVSEIFDDQETFGMPVNIISIRSILDDISSIGETGESDPRVWLAGGKLTPALIITIRRPQLDKGRRLLTLEVSLAAMRKFGRKRRTYKIIRRGCFVYEKGVIPRKLDLKVDFPPFLAFAERAMVVRVARMFLFSAAAWLKQQEPSKINKRLETFVRKAGQILHAYVSNKSNLSVKNSIVPPTILPGAFYPIVQHFNDRLKQLISDRSALPEDSYRLFEYRAKGKVELSLEEVYKCDFGLPSWYVSNLDILGWSWLKQPKDYLPENSDISLISGPSEDHGGNFLGNTQLM